MKILLRNSVINRVAMPKTHSNFFSNTITVRDERGWWETANPELDFCIFDTENPKSSPLFCMLKDEYNYGPYKGTVMFLKDEIEKVNISLPSGKQYLEEVLSCYLSGEERETGKIYDAYIVS